MNTDGSDRKTIVSDCDLPDGGVVDVEAGHIYWTNMGIPNLNDGSVEGADIDGETVDATEVRPTPSFLVSTVPDAYTGGLAETWAPGKTPSRVGH